MKPSRGRFVAPVVAFIVWRLYAIIVVGRRAYLELAAWIAPMTSDLAAG